MAGSFGRPSVRDHERRNRMFSWFSQRAKRQTVATSAHVPERSRIYAIGDIHGRADLLGELHGIIRADAETAPARRVLVYLGDYVDRGLQSRGVIDMVLRNPFSDFEVVCLRGNHEAVLLDFLKDPAVGREWVQFGGAETLMSYQAGCLSSDAAHPVLVAAQEEFARRLPEDHLAFFQNLALHHEEGDYYFVHAGVRPGVALNQQASEDLLWIRNEFLEFRGSFGCVVVHGHTITEEPDVHDNRIGIDTGAFATGRLTCLVLEGTERRFLST
jgi:serine/threonine protein phosphatase 1